MKKPLRAAAASLSASLRPGPAARRPAAAAAAAAARPGRARSRRIYTNVHTNITKAVEQFPADKLTWQPTPAVRSWARLIGHITDDNNGACYLLAGETDASRARRHRRHPGVAPPTSCRRTIC